MGELEESSTTEAHEREDRAGVDTDAPRAPAPEHFVTTERAPGWFGRSVLALALALAIAAGFAAITDDTAIRVAAFGFIVPAATAAVFGLVVAVDRALARRTAAADEARGELTDFAEAARADRSVLATGVLRCAAPSAVSENGTTHAAVLTRRDTGRGVEITSTTSELLLDTADRGTLELERGPWEISDPLGAGVLRGEAMLDDGLPVVVRAFVEPRSAAGVDYRGRGLTYVLKKGGRVTPVGMRPSSRIVHASTLRLRAPITVALVVAAFAAGVTLLRREPAPVQTSAAVATPTEAPAPPRADRRCAYTKDCDAGAHCDPARHRCTRDNLGTGAEGDPCSTKQGCAEGLVCSQDLFEPERALRCVKPCERRGECRTDEWCAPCFAPRVGVGMCLAKSHARGAMGALCGLPEAPAAATAVPSQ